MSGQHELTTTGTNGTDTVDDLKTSDAHVEEVVISRLTEEDIFKMSKEALQLKSWAGFRILLILIVQGCNQAGYGVDWAVISGIVSFANHTTDSPTYFRRTPTQHSIPSSKSITRVQPWLR